MSLTRRSIRKAILAMAAALLLLSLATQAWAISPSWTHNQKYSFVIMKNTPHYSSGQATAYLSNDTKVYMKCWIDTENVTDRDYSNYNSPRWFKVSVASSGKVGYVHSSYVYYQQTVGHC